MIVRRLIELFFGLWCCTPLVPRCFVLFRAFLLKIRYEENKGKSKRLALISRSWKVLFGKILHVRLSLEFRLHNPLMRAAVPASIKLA